MPDLILHVKAEYFNDIKAGIKKEEYRLLNDHWKTRIAYKEFDNVIIALGYPKRDDESRRIKFKYKGFKIKTITHKHFGKDPVRVYAIKLER